VYKALDGDGYDDGGVADLTLVIDLEDNGLRRKRGDMDYFTALKADLLPRVKSGQLRDESRREQKVQLARMLFSEEQEDEACEVYVDNVDGTEDEETIKRRTARLQSAKHALYLSTVLREPACSALSLAEIAKRYLALKGKEGAEDALRCSNKAVAIASDGFYDNDLIAIEVRTILLDLCCVRLSCHFSNWIFVSSGTYTFYSYVGGRGTQDRSKARTERDLPRSGPPNVAQAYAKARARTMPSYSSPAQGQRSIGSGPQQRSSRNLRAGAALAPERTPHHTIGLGASLHHSQYWKHLHA